MTATEHEQAFTAMLRDNHAALARLARRYAAPEEWRDLLQEMHLQLWRSFDGFDARSKLSTWVYRVALNTALSHLRKPRREHQLLEHAVDRGDAGAPGDEMTVLGAFLDRLDPLNRSLLLLDLEGLERDEIAKILGLSPGAVAVRMTRLRQAFETQFLETR